MPRSKTVVDEKIDINTIDIAKIVISVEKMNSETGQIRDRLTAVEVNTKWVKWFVMGNTLALLGLVLNVLARMLI